MSDHRITDLKPGHLDQSRHTCRAAAAAVTVLKASGV